MILTTIITRTRIVIHDKTTSNTGETRSSTRNNHRSVDEEKKSSARGSSSSFGALTGVARPK